MPDETRSPSPKQPPITRPPAGLSRPVVRLTPDLYEAAAARLVSAEAGDSAQAGRRFVQAAPAHGIDLAMMWGTVEESRKSDRFVRQACLVVMGAGKTAVLFLSGPVRGQTGALQKAEGHAERVAAIQAACSWLAQEKPGTVRIVQSLPEPRERWAIDALEGAGLRRVGDLAYLRCPLSRRRSPPPPPPAWPEGITVRAVGSVKRGEPDRTLLAEALERSYEATLDCPGLCGMRETDDVIDSHISTGAFDPSLWWLVLADGQAHGCSLFNPCPEQSTVELVYLGLSPQMRGHGLARRLLAHALARVAGPGRLSVTCAVDRQNAPAISLYRRANFSEFSGRVAYVRPLP